MISSSQILTLQSLFLEANKIALDFYRSTETKVQIKEDNSPVTEADLAVDSFFQEKLSMAFPYPLVTEEHEKNLPAGSLETFWLLDPIDGTKEFVEQTDFFSINLALIHKKEPVFGMISSPVFETLYWTEDGNAWKKELGKDSDEGAKKLSVRPPKNNPLIQIQSRRQAHFSALENELSHFNVGSNKIAGSALKFCYLAEGQADFYLRHGPTYEWDTAAGQAILEAAGGYLFDLETQKRFSYQKDDYLNQSFLATNLETPFDPNS